MKDEKKYEMMFGKIMDYQHEVHERNQKRIRIGLKCIWIIPLIFLGLMFWTESSKIIFLVLWILSLFGLSFYLITVEYMDYQLQERLHELDEEPVVKELVVADLEKVEENMKRVMKKRGRKKHEK